MSNQHRSGSEPPDRGSTAIRSLFDWPVTPPHSAVTEIVAATAGRDPVEFPALYGTVAPEASDRIVAPEPPSRENAALRVSSPDAGGKVGIDPSRLISVVSA